MSPKGAGECGERTADGDKGNTKEPEGLMNSTWKKRGGCPSKSRSEGEGLRRQKACELKQQSRGGVQKRAQEI